MKELVFFCWFVKSLIMRIKFMIVRFLWNYNFEVSGQTRICRIDRYIYKCYGAKYVIGKVVWREYIMCARWTIFDKNSSVLSLFVRYFWSRCEDKYKLFCNSSWWFLFSITILIYLFDSCHFFQYVIEIIILNGKLRIISDLRYKCELNKNKTKKKKL